MNRRFEPLTFPITEIFGYPNDVRSAAAREAQQGKMCPFAGNKCEKYRQYKMGYCSVSYAAEADAGRRRTYAVCDHRLDGPPIKAALESHFAPTDIVHIASEVVLADPRISFDYVAFSESQGFVTDVIAIETQAIDLRGGGVGPAFRAWENGEASEWRKYFALEAAAKGRKDTVAYGVNMGNIYKRLGLQIAEKGTFLKSIGVPLCIIMQDLPFQYLNRRVKFHEEASSCDLTFLTFEYTDATLPDGQLGFQFSRRVRTSLEGYIGALAANNRSGDSLRNDFLRQVMLKAGRI